jgi:DNA-binding transcriptional ArsR family regulator
MVKHASGSLDAVFAALADPTRRELVARLADGESSVGDLAEPFAISLPAISRHLKVLETAGLVERTKDGRIHRIQLRADPMLEAVEWMARYGRFWETQLDALGHYLRESPGAKGD